MLVDLPANHAVMTDGRGTNCGTANPPLFIEDCGFESIQAMFSHLYSNMNPPVAFGTGTGELRTFEQVYRVTVRIYDKDFCKYLESHCLIRSFFSSKTSVL